MDSGGSGEEKLMKPVGGAEDQAEAHGRTARVRGASLQPQGPIVHTVMCCRDAYKRGDLTVRPTRQGSSATTPVSSFHRLRRRSSHCQPDSGGGGQEGGAQETFPYSQVELQEEMPVMSVFVYLSEAPAAPCSQPEYKVTWSGGTWTVLNKALHQGQSERRVLASSDGGVFTRQDGVIEDPPDREMEHL
ncbi:hypothetical protein H920_15060 [Fukomys damarensis]|uniref:Uncharacterized protein n=1 Tax=Fukomys damarensis TaxID=885580 RepID=A0A091CZ10_FUKDA|nr:hypothetical protein H920_15060 [Fukomys damarensis]